MIQPLSKQKSSSTAIEMWSTNGSTVHQQQNSYKPTEQKEMVKPSLEM